MNEADKNKIAEIMARHGAVLGYLFGSAARGTMGPHSDIDVAVLFRDDIPINTHSKLELMISIELRQALNLYHVNVFNITSVDPFLKHKIILAEGESIYVADQRLKTGLVCLTLHEYEDAVGFREQAYKMMAAV